MYLIDEAKAKLIRRSIVQLLKAVRNLNTDVNQIEMRTEILSHLPEDKWSTQNTNNTIEELEILLNDLKKDVKKLNEKYNAFCDEIE